MFWAIGMAVLYTVKRAASSALSWLLILPIKEQQRSTYPRRRILAFVPYGLSVLTQMERFVCCSCEKLGLPSFFVSKRAVRIHMGKSKKCKGGECKRITVMTRPGDVIAGGSGGMGPCPPPQHQPPGIYL